MTARGDRTQNRQIVRLMRIRQLGLMQHAVSV
jgi:hypothetical protein